MGRDEGFVGFLSILKYLGFMSKNFYFFKH